MALKKEVNNLKNIGNILRIDSLRMTTEAGSGHPTSCLSCADLLAALFFHEMRYDPINAKNPENDEFILSKGHAAAIYYAALLRAGCIKDALLSYRKLSSNLEGHPIPFDGWVKVATGSLGQGLSVGIGMAIAAKLNKREYRTFVLLGDSEIAEGEVYEALQLAPYYKLNNLCAIIDINRLGQRGETMVGWNIDKYTKRFASFGWDVEVINGHNIAQIISVLRKFKRTKKPFVILAKTVKGKGVSFLENKEGWHGRTLNNTELKNALDEIHIDENIEIKINKSRPVKNKKGKSQIKKPLITKYAQNISISTREAYGNALSNLAKINKNILAVDADVSNSTFAEKVKFSVWKQFIEAFIAEQNMISLSLGLSIKGFNVFTSSFAAFLSRAHDQLRMAALSKAPMTICGSHAGVSIGQDGASQMGLEDISMFRDLPNSIIFYPSDAISTEKLIFLSASLIKNSIKYIRTTRPKTPIIYLPKETFFLGDFKILKEKKDDKIVLIGAGITLHESIKAHELLDKKRINSAVIDLYCIKPLKVRKLISFIKKHGKRVVITEDHYEEGGVGEMLEHELSNTGIKISHLAIREAPHSGTTEELLKKYGIDSYSIAKAAMKLISS